MKFAFPRKSRRPRPSALRKDAPSPSPAVMDLLEPRLLLTGTIEGFVRDAANSNPLSGVEVDAYSYQPDGGTSRVGGAVTDTSGMYTIANLPAQSQPFLPMATCHPSIALRSCSLTAGRRGPTEVTASRCAIRRDS